MLSNGRALPAPLTINEPPILLDRIGSISIPRMSLSEDRLQWNQGSAVTCHSQGVIVFTNLGSNGDLRTNQSIVTIIKKGSLKPLITPFSLPSRTPNIILELLQLVHFLIFPDLCGFILKYEGPGDDCRALFTSSNRTHRTRSNLRVSTKVPAWIL